MKTGIKTIDLLSNDEFVNLCEMYFGGRSVFEKKPKNSNEFLDEEIK